MSVNIEINSMALNVFENTISEINEAGIFFIVSPSTYFKTGFFGTAIKGNLYLNGQNLETRLLAIEERLDILEGM